MNRYQAEMMDELLYEMSEEFNLDPSEYEPIDGDADYDEGSSDEPEHDDSPAGDGGHEQPEAKQFTQDEIDRIIGERLARERQKYQGYDRYASHAKKFEQMVGMPLEQALQELEQQAQAERIQAQAQQMGVDPRTAQAMMMQENKLKQLESQHNYLIRKMTIDQQRAELKDAPFFNEYAKEIDEVVRDVPGVDLKTAYHYVIGEHLQDILQNNAAGAKQKTLRDIQKGAKAFVEGKGEGDGGTVQLPREMLEMARTYGVNPKNLAKRMARKK